MPEVYGWPATSHTRHLSQTWNWDPGADSVAFTQFAWKVFDAGHTLIGRHGCSDDHIST